MDFALTPSIWKITVIVLVGCSIPIRHADAQLFADDPLAGAETVEEKKQTLLKTEYVGSDFAGLLKCEQDLVLLQSSHKIRYLDTWTIPISNRGLKIIGGIKPLRSLTITSLKTMTPDFSPLANLRGFTELSIQTGFQGHGLEDSAMRTLEGCTTIESFSVSSDRFTGTGLKVLRAFPKLVGLHLSNCSHFDGQNLHYLNNRPLKWFNIWNTPVETAHVAHLPCHRLMWLDLSLTKVDDGLASVLGEDLPDLEEVRLLRTQVGNKTVAALTNATKLRQLDLTATVINAEALHAIGECETLVSLNLNGCNLSGGDFSQLANLSRLKFLRLENTGLTAGDLSELAKIKSLTSLNVSNNPIKGADLVQLNPLAKLESLAVCGIKIPGATLDILRRMPKLQHVAGPRRFQQIRLKPKEDVEAPMIP